MFAGTRSKFSIFIFREIPRKMFIVSTAGLQKMVMIDGTVTYSTNDLPIGHDDCKQRLLEKTTTLHMHT